MGRQKYSKADIARCQRLADKGLSAREIEKETGIKANTVASWRKAGKMRPAAKRGPRSRDFGIATRSPAQAKAERESGLTSEDAGKKLTGEQRRRARGAALRNSPLAGVIERRVRSKLPPMVNIKDGEKPDG